MVPRSRLRTRSGYEVRITGDHKVLTTERGDVPVHALEIGHAVAKDFEERGVRVHDAPLLKDRDHVGIVVERRVGEFHDLLAVDVERAARQILAGLHHALEVGVAQLAAAQIVRAQLGLGRQEPHREPLLRDDELLSQVQVEHLVPVVVVAADPEQREHRTAQPPFERIGVIDLESCYPAAERFKLAMSLNNLLASPSFASWLEGEPLDVARMLLS